MSTYFTATVSKYVISLIIISVVCKTVEWRGRPQCAMCMRINLQWELQFVSEERTETETSDMPNLFDFQVLPYDMPSLTRVNIL